MNTTSNLSQESGAAFSKYGTLVAFLLVTAEWFFHWGFYSFANPDLWEDGPPYRIFFYLNFLVAGAIFLIVLFRPALKIELTDNAGKFDGFKKDFFSTLALTVFGFGAFIIFSIAQARVYGDLEIFPFVHSNDLVISSTKPFSFIDQLLYPAIAIFIFQGFLLNGLTKLSGYKVATLLTALAFGIKSGDYVGGALYGLFLNHLFRKSGNIFFPVAIAVLVNLVYLIISVAAPSILILKVGINTQSENILKGVIIMAVMSPLMIPLFKETYFAIINDGSPIINQETEEVEG